MKESSRIQKIKKTQGEKIKNKKNRVTLTEHHKLLELKRRKKMKKTNKTEKEQETWNFLFCLLQKKKKKKGEEEEKRKWLIE